VALTSLKTIDIAGVRANTFVSTSPTADVRVIASRSISWSVAQPLQRHFIIAATSAGTAADVNITAVAGTVSLHAQTAVKSQSKSYSLLSAIGTARTLQLTSTHESGDVVFEAAQAQVVFNFVTSLSLVASPSTCNQQRIGTIEWQSRGTSDGTDECAGRRIAQFGQQRR
jgi:hypothetical protein